MEKGGYVYVSVIIVGKAQQVEQQPESNPRHCVALSLKPPFLSLAFL